MIGQHATKLHRLHCGGTWPQTQLAREAVKLVIHIPLHTLAGARSEPTHWHSEEHGWEALACQMHRSSCKATSSDMLQADGGGQAMPLWPSPRCWLGLRLYCVPTRSTRPGLEHHLNIFQRGMICSFTLADLAAGNPHVVMWQCWPTISAEGKSASVVCILGVRPPGTKKSANVARPMPNVIRRTAQSLPFFRIRLFWTLSASSAGFCPRVRHR